MEGSIYTFGIRTSDPEEADIMRMRIPDGEDPRRYFEEQTGESVISYWYSGPEAKERTRRWLENLRKQRAADGT